MQNVTAPPPVIGREHWTRNGDSDLFLWQKAPADDRAKAGTVLFVHGSSMASQPTFDLQVPGRPFSSAMDYFVDKGFETWTLDLRGYGRSDKRPGTQATIAEGAEDLSVATDYIMRETGCRAFHTYGISSGALRAAAFAEMHPDRVKRLALDAFVWTGEGSHTLDNRRKKLPDFRAGERRPIDKAFVYSIFNRDHPGAAEDNVIEAFADAITALDDSMPNGTYIDMCTRLPLIDPAKVTVPTIIMRGEWDGIAGVDDLLAFFKRLPNADKQFAVMPGISHASLQQKNYMLVFHILHSFSTQPDPVYRG